MANNDIYYIGPNGAYKKFQHIGNGHHAEVQSVLDPDEIAFYAGREFRTFQEFSIAQGASSVIKVVSTGDTIVYEFSIRLTAESAKLELVTGGTEGGSFSTALPILRCNTMSVCPVVTSGVTMNSGGTHSGGTVADIIYADTGQGSGAKAEGFTQDYPTGFAAGTFYVRITNTGNNTCTGVFRARWEER